MKNIKILISGLVFSVVAYGQNTIEVKRGFNYQSQIATLKMDENQAELYFSGLTVITMKKDRGEEMLSEQSLQQTYTMPASRTGDIFDCEVIVESTLSSHGEVIHRGTIYTGQYFSTRKCSKSENCKNRVSAGFSAAGQNYLSITCREVGTLRQTIPLDHLRGDDLTKLRTCQNAGGKPRIFNEYAGTDECANMVIAPTFETLRRQLAERGLQLTIKNHSN